MFDYLWYCRIALTVAINAFQFVKSLANVTSRHALVVLVHLLGGQNYSWKQKHSKVEARNFNFTRTTTQTQFNFTVFNSIDWINLFSWTLTISLSTTVTTTNVTKNHVAMQLPNQLIDHNLCHIFTGSG